MFDVNAGSTRTFRTGAQARPNRSRSLKIATIMM
jgi:hypothetical protein